MTAETDHSGLTSDHPGAEAVPILNTSDSDRVRTLTLNRPDTLNAFNEALYDELAEALPTAAEDPNVGVVLLTGTGRAFCAGTDLKEMFARSTDPDFTPGKHGFLGLIDALAEFPKPLVVAANGLGVGLGLTLLGFADLAFASTEAAFQCPFTSLGVAPEAASSYLLPQLLGRQNAAWILLSAEWVTAQQAYEMGLVWQLCPPTDLLSTAHQHCTTLAARPISSLRAVKATMTAPLRAEIAAARERENAHFAELFGGPANLEAMTAFAEGREPDFASLPHGG